MAASDGIREYAPEDLPGPDHRAEGPMDRLLAASTRRWLYLILTAAVPLLIVYGVVDHSTAPLWIALGGAVLGFPLAAANTPTGGAGRDPS